jgi:hypothetical protein
MPTVAKARERRWAWVLAASAFIVSGFLPAARGQENVPKGGPAGSDKEGANRRIVERWKREMAEYTIVTRTEPETVLRLRAEPALHWTNPIRESDNGLVFLWLADNRPAAIVCFYRSPWQGRILESHEFHSLAPVGLIATRGGQKIWAPSGAGIIFRPIPGAEKPAGTPAERLRQLRGLARGFQGVVDPDKGKTELRLLSQPLFRYESGQSASHDGAIFAFVLTTDPEAVVVIEERAGAAGQDWHYAFAKMTNHSLAMRLGDRVVWEVPPDRDYYTDSTRPYFVRWDEAPAP